ncbi:MAG: serine hydrolase [Hyphomonadaceae bacterium]
MLRLSMAVLCAALVLAPMARAADWPACGRVDVYPSADWPAARGWNAQRLDAARRVFEGQDSAALVVLHRGRLVAAWGAPETRYTAQSVRKALLNSLVGLEVAGGRLRLDASLADLDIDDDPPLTPSERRATVRDLLMSRSGIFHSALYEVGGWTRARRTLVERERASGRDLYGPGDYWVYNNWDFNALGTIVERAAGEEIGPLFARRVAAPIGMQDFRAEDVEYTTRDHPAERRFGNASDHRAYVFNISTRDLARYGLLYLGCGRWGRRQIVPRDWVLASIDGRDTREGRAEDERETGFDRYGYLWQVDLPETGRYGLGLRTPYYIATGSRGHVLFVFPGLDLVIAHQVATVGGVSAEAQQRRATRGTPEVTDAQIAQLVTAIIAAHPRARRAFAH